MLQLSTDMTSITRMKWKPHKSVGVDRVKIKIRSAFYSSVFLQQFITVDNKVSLFHL